VCKIALLDDASQIEIVRIVADNTAELYEGKKLCKVVRGDEKDRIKVSGGTAK
jgi:hypothetical protein